MADEGNLFMDAHSTSAVCTPTRYSLLTGRYSLLTGRYNWRSVKARGVLSGSSPHLIPADRPTIAHMLRKVGYTPPKCSVSGTSAGTVTRTAATTSRGLSSI